MHKPVNKIRIAQRTMLTLASLMMAALPFAAQAAGLGKIAVFSALGEPLRAEIEVFASADEAQSIQTRLATVDAFRQANIDYAPALTALRFSTIKERDGQRYIQVTSDRPLNEPFVDMLVELNWAAGRLVREYTFLLDPPPANGQAGVPPTAPVFVASPAASPAGADTSAAASPAAVVKSREKPVARALKPAGSAKPTAATTAPAAEKVDDAGQRRYTVASGDTLGKIAARNMPAGVTLEQMLVALFRGNESAFSGKNMNRLRAGKILLIPDAGTASDIPVGEAHKVVVAQAADFNAYRQKLAAIAAQATAAPEPAAAQADSGKIVPKVAEAAPPIAGKDKLEVSRTETGKDGKAKDDRVAALEEDLIARDKALKEAAQRSAELEKQLADLKKLVELKSKTGSELQQQMQVGKPAGATAVPIKEADKVADQSKAEGMNKNTDRQKESTPAAVAPAAVAESKPAEIAKPAENAPPPKPKKKKIVLPPPEPEPSFIEENGALVFGGGGILALLLGWFGFKTWKKRQAAADDEAIEPEFSVHSSLSTPADSAVPPSEQQASRFSDTVVPPPIDVLAEADTFLAFGRDAQAEEVLRAALETQPERHAIYLKLLDIYAARKNRQDFEAIAKRLHGLTDGQGEDWERAATMGAALDAENPLYRLPLAASAESAEPAEIIKAAAESESVAETSAMPEPPPSVIDFDLTPAALEPASAPGPVTAATVDANVLDFDLDLGEPATATETTPAPADLSLSAVAHETAATGDAAKDAHSLDFDFDLELDEPAEASPSLNLSGLDLDLDAPASADAVPPAPTFDVTGEGGDNPEVATKLELAAAYEEMGDHEGARELYQEALAEGSHAQQDAARAKLAALG